MDRAQFKRWYQAEEPRYARLADHVRNEIENALKVRGIIAAKIEHRVKDIESASNKSQKLFATTDGEDALKYADPKNDIADFAGVRIVAYLTSDLEPICNMITKLFNSDVDNYTNKLDVLGESGVGYLSIHYVVSLKDEIVDKPEYAGLQKLKCEIQIRTILQHAWAQIFHDRQYKFNDKVECPIDLLRTTNLIAGNLELSDRLISTVVKKYDCIFGNPDPTAHQAILDMKVCERSLPLYIKQKLGLSYNTRYINSERVFRVLNNFDVKILRHLDNYVTQDFVDVFTKTDLFFTVDRFIDCLFIFHDHKAYFTKCHKKAPQFISEHSYSLLKSIVDIDKICREYSLSVHKKII